MNRGQKKKKANVAHFPSSGLMFVRITRDGRQLVKLEPKPVGWLLCLESRTRLQRSNNAVRRSKLAKSGLLEQEELQIASHFYQRKKIE
jgi:hypothetical protein